jgi:hypothetical protein
MELQRKSGVQGNGDNYGPSARIARSGLTFVATGRKCGIWPTFSQREYSKIVAYREAASGDKSQR